MKLPGHLARRGTLTRSSHGLFKALTERRFARQLGHSLHPHPAGRTADPVDFNDHRRPVFAPRQVSHLPLPVIVHLGELPPATRADQLAVPPFPPHPYTHGIGFLIDLVPVYSATRPSQDFR